MAAQTEEPRFSCAAFPETLPLDPSEVAFGMRFDQDAVLDPQVNIEFSVSVTLDAANSRAFINGVHQRSGTSSSTIPCRRRRP